MRISDWSSDVCSSDLVADGEQIKALVLAEEAFGDAEGLFLADEHADVRLERHFGESDRDAAVGDVVACRDPAGADRAADEIAGAPFGFQVDGRRRAFLATMDFAQPHLLAEVHHSFANGP